MATATLTSKGQTTIPKDIRDFLKISPGDKLDFIVDTEGRVILRPATVDVKDLRGLLYKKGRAPVSLEDMERAIVAGSSRGRK